MKPLLQLLRPHQWIKNGFVFTGLLFVRGWNDPELLLQVVLAAAGFSLAAGGVYVLNDLADREEDRRHPVKRSRALAAGRVSTGSARLLAGGVVTAGLLLGYQVSLWAFLLLAGYLVLNLLYTRWLKRVVILDVFVLASGFFLRILVGTVGVEIPPSKWLVLCGIMLALFLGFGKRQAELLEARDGKYQGRDVLSRYSEKLLDSLLAVTCGGVLITYALYTVDEGTVLQHHTTVLIYTVPVVAYGLFRYLYLIQRRELGQDSAQEVFKDSHLLATVLLWLAAVLFILNESRPLT